MKKVARAAGAVLLSFAGLSGAATQLLVPAAAPPGASPKSFGIPAGVPVRFNLDELKHLAPGAEVELTLASAGSHAYVFELSEKHGGEVSSWIGRHKEKGNDLRAIVTTGPGGSYGVFNTPQGEYRLIPGDGHDWLFETAAAKAAEGSKIDLRDDARIPPVGDRKAAPDSYLAGAIEAVEGVNVVPRGKSTPAPQTVIDLYIVYTNGFATKLGANLNTRLNFLVTRANTSYADSEVAITLRLVGSSQVTYSDAVGSLTALEAITPPRAAFNAAVFGGIEALRTAAGADMVAFLRDGSNFGGDGVAWMNSPPLSSAIQYMYSVTTGCMASCESVFIHEVGHNMGNNHDRATAAWQNGGAPDTGGSYPYSFGYVFCKSGTYACDPFRAPGAGGCAAGTQPECSTNDPSSYADLMSYFHATTDGLYKFSNAFLFCKAAGGDGIDRPCGVLSSLANSADTALSMNNNRVALAALKPTVVPLQVPSATTLTSAPNPSVALALAVTYTATVTGAGGTPTGTVDFKANQGTLCAGSALTAGSAQCVTAATAPGVNSVTAEYSGSANFAASTSPAIFQTVMQGAGLVLTANPAVLDFGGQSMNTTSPTLTSTITNSSGGGVVVTGVTAYGSGYAVAGHTCAAVANGSTCAVTVTFTPPAAATGGVVNGTIAVTYAGAGPTPIRLTAVSEKSLVSHYYRSILRRAPDSGGKTYWEGEATRVGGLGANLNEVWFAMAQAFYFSPEYAAFNRTNTAFVTDLYTTFFNRAPDSGGLNFWVTNITSGMPREVVLAGFMFSTEFASFTQAIFSNATVRAEVNTIVDFYRGLLARTPDTGGFNFWVGRFRTAQCLNAAAVTNEVEAISSAFTQSSEYTTRARNNPQYVGDLYNAFLRRGGDLGGVNFWITQVGGAQTREQLRGQFKNSPEFQARVAAILAQGCL